MTDGALVSNQVTAGSGGAIALSSRVVAELAGDILIAGNVVSSYGGGLYADFSAVVRAFASVSFQGNSAANGGACFAIQSVLILEGNVSLQDNRASGHGGAVYLFTSVANVSGTVSIKNNTCGGFGGAIYSETFTALFIQEQVSMVNNKASSGGALAVRCCDSRNLEQLLNRVNEGLS
jgi:predicted outer membrane repeat protein